MAARKDVEKAVHIKEFQRTVNQLLTPEDKDYLFYAMKEYHTYKSVAKLMLALNSCLDTPEKLDLLPYVRDLIPKHDKKRFDNLAPYDRMAHPLKVDRMTSDSLGKLVSNSPGSYGGFPQQESSSSTRIITLHRSPGSSLGFSIRGGKEHDLGIFVSNVDSFSLAEQSGLEPGDQIVAVNGIPFDRLSHSSAVLVLKSHDNLKIEVKHMGCVPGQKLGRNSFIWVDPAGNELEDDGQMELEQIVQNGTDERDGEGSRLLSSADKHKIVLHTDKKRPLGFSVRGGAEYGLGIYISMVDQGSPSDESGLRVGDQIVDVNGHSFNSVFHQEAVHILRSYPTLIMTIKSLGKLPTLATKSQQGERRHRSNTLPRKFGSTLNNNNPQTSETSGSPRGTAEDHTPVKRRSATVRRSQSERRSVTLPAEGGADFVDYGTPSESEQRRLARSSTPGVNVGSSRKKPMIISPLATHESRAAPSPSFSSPTAVKFFEQGVGTQVMLASMSSRAKELLIDHARRKMREADVNKLKESLEKYEQDNDLTDFVDDLITLFNTHDKIKLLTDVRSVLNPAHIVEFDEKVSPLELEALHLSDTESGGSGEDVMVDYNTALASAHKPRWSPSLHSTDKKSSLPDLGALGGSKEATGLQKMFHVTSSSDPNLSHGNSRESYLSSRGDQIDGGSHEPRGNDQASMPTPYPLSKATPIMVDVPKESAFLGMAVKGGSDTPYKKVYVRELRPGGAVYKDGFIQPGFEVVQIDEQRIRGKTYGEAVEAIAEAYNSDSPTIKIIVIPGRIPD